MAVGLGMNPIYKFTLSANGQSQQAYPVYKDDLAIEYALEQNQKFYRGKLSGKLIFEGPDYEFIISRAFDTQFMFEIYISHNAGQTWESYWHGMFWKTDCEFDENNKIITVTPDTEDAYIDVLNGLDKEYNLIDLAPDMAKVNADKRPMIQVYIPGQSVIGCFLSGMWWEQECEPVEETDVVVIGGQERSALEYKYRFRLNKSMVLANSESTTSPVLPEFFYRDVQDRFNPYYVGVQEFQASNGEYVFSYFYTDAGGQAGQYAIACAILRASDNLVMWQYVWQGAAPPVVEMPYTITLTPTPGAGSTGNARIVLTQQSVYARFVCDTDSVGALQTYDLPDDDLVSDNRNYHKVLGYYIPRTISFSDRLTATPTQWGLYQPGMYYNPPYSIYGAEFFPVARSAWGRNSIWFSFYIFDWIIEQSARKTFTINHAYPLSSAISAILKQIAPNITHEATPEYSEFLYGDNWLSYRQTLLITPKSNIILSGYDQPAQKAPITLQDILAMLRDCFRCYWYIDTQNRLRIEHVLYFLNGGSYLGYADDGVDLTKQLVPRNNKPWAFGQKKYSYDKPDMPERYQFAWMDDVTQLFEGFPINILSNYVNKGRIEQITINSFTSDVDFMLLNPSAVSKDGFCLMAASYVNILAQQIVLQLDGGGTAEVDVSDLGFDNYVGAMATINIQLSQGTVAGYFYDGTRYHGWGRTITPSVNSVDVRIVPGIQKIVFRFGTAGATVTITDIMPQRYVLPYQNYVIGTNDHYLQNAFLAFCILQRYYVYDMPAKRYEINGVEGTAQKTKRLKKQEVRFQALEDVNMLKTVKTFLGSGTIEKLSINLQNRGVTATLCYDTE